MICDCCGSESGYEDLQRRSILAARERWLENSFAWFTKKKRPVRWNADTQMSQIPEKYK
jgi:hypothetical protein